MQPGCIGSGSGRSGDWDEADGEIRAGERRRTTGSALFSQAGVDAKGEVHQPVKRRRQVAHAQFVQETLSQLVVEGPVQLHLAPASRRSQRAEFNGIVRDGP